MDLARMEGCNDWVGGGSARRVNPSVAVRSAQVGALSKSRKALSRPATGRFRANLWAAQVLAQAIFMGFHLAPKATLGSGIR
jgi:hypothetical protein